MDICDKLFWIGNDPLPTHRGRCYRCLRNTHLINSPILKSMEIPQIFFISSYHQKNYIHQIHWNHFSQFFSTFLLSNITFNAEFVKFSSTPILQIKRVKTWFEWVFKNKKRAQLKASGQPIYLITNYPLFCFSRLASEGPDMPDMGPIEIISHPLSSTLLMSLAVVGKGHPHVPKHCHTHNRSFDVVLVHWGVAKVIPS